ncbi:sugar isomerase [Streptomyces lunaelactis]|uniref:Sugar isomerase n=1 Tax=Streptomyces lunaelactis TaxID=1535768 RepID=A0A2R4T3U6_9ACTN|nr:sugar isomerase [Streptomyces lunaelactis]AVZ73782.1 sugar isomerase [Streptomyces lunaelactis]NUK04567.1 sugar isomerase [Streptomyces lunaelactis]NUK19467.1 sugar isomerase [Streptomyces lunaelactis]NUK53524.1 sugar isomerase [Streptomyces lunaelactis]NUK61219.1 sugar isomerase [Streptomyces lunaelactis]
MSRTAAEIATQPACWRRAAEAAALFEGLPEPGERVAVTGCGTSWFMAIAYAALREAAGHGETDAFASSEFPSGRSYDRVVAITRSGTTTEVLELLSALRGKVPTLALTADPKTPVMDAADAVAVLDWADEESVVQTRFATTALAFLRAGLGDIPGVKPVAEAAVDAELAITEPLPEAVVGAEQWTFLGRGWTYGLALEAALKMREAAGAWTESYPAMEYRHGPISITGPGRVAWVFGTLPEGLSVDVARVGGTLVARQEADPLADLIRAQRLAVTLAESKGYDPDHPRNLTRSVILSS